MEEKWMLRKTLNLKMNFVFFFIYFFLILLTQTKELLQMLHF